MIQVSRMNGEKYILNCELIKFVEAIPDTLVTLSTGEKLLVRESVSDVIQQTVDYHRKLKTV